MEIEQNCGFTAAQKRFFDRHVRAHVSPYATQTPKQALIRKWYWHNFSTTDKAFALHFKGKIAIALPPRWYPFANLDLDDPRAQAAKVFNRLQELGIGADQILLVSTPRYKQNGNFRIYLNLQLHGNPVTAKLAETFLRTNFPNCEFNPNGLKADRLIFGFGSEVLDPFTHKIIKMSKEKRYELLDRLKPVELSEIERDYITIPAPVKVKGLGSAKQKSKFVAEAEELKEFGLQSGGFGRHDAQWRLLFLLWVKYGFTDLQATAFVKNWIRCKHNNRSEAVKSGDWRRIDGEIDRQAKSVFAAVTTKFPDIIHNQLFGNTAGDILAAAKFAPGDAVRQKYYFNLLGVIRPKFHHEWITIRAETWIAHIASSETYLRFERELEAKGLMVSDRQYVPGSKSRKYKFNFTLEDAPPLVIDGRHVNSYYEALKTAYSGDSGATQAIIAHITGLNRMTVWRNFQKL